MPDDDELFVFDQEFAMEAAPRVAGPRGPRGHAPPAPPPAQRPERIGGRR